ncbi:MAG: LamG domain-containing protein [Flavobacteriales bacterium]|nr:LamG domain-containing protein [Flavobacteriales bacterium]
MKMTSKFLSTANKLTRATFLFTIVITVSAIIVSCGKGETQEAEDVLHIQASLNCLPDNLQDGLLAFYPFDNGSLLDHSGNGHDLMNTTTAMVTPDRSNNTLCAYEFIKANNEFLTQADPQFLNSLTQLTISLWYNSSALGDPSSFESILSRGTGAHCPDTYGEWSIGIYDCRRPVFGYANNRYWEEAYFEEISQTEGINTCADYAAIMNEVWHHLVVTYDNGTYQMWLDGILTDYVPDLGICFDPQVMEDLGDFFIGHSFGGKVDDVAIYDHTLEATEIDELRNLEACCGE